ncbi:hypothetical protein [Anaerotignum sp.]|uniref:hypothetical protein n=1 Tax=Anaerotignum sp. TaxID=2039241 RepID=UPI0028B06121|nr:hypothetical protein [Anaerotignum sp.]
MENTNELIEQLTEQYNKFKFNRTILILCELYFAYTYIVDFQTGSITYRVLMGIILLAMAILAFYAHRKMSTLQEQIQIEKQKCPI